METETPADRRRLADWVHRTLLAGLMLSGVLLATGLVLALLGHRPRPEGPPPPVSSILRGALNGQASGLIDLGLLVLMVTPIARVAALALGWGLEREWRFLAVATTVLVLLGVGLMLGMG